MFTSSFAGLIPNVGLGPYCVAKYGVGCARPRPCRREVGPNGIGVSVLCPHDRGDQPDGQHRARQERRLRPGLTRTRQTANGWHPRRRMIPFVNVEDVARLTTKAILANRLYVLPHRAARRFDPAPVRAHRPHLRRPDRRGLDALTSRVQAGTRRSADCDTSRSRPASPVDVDGLAGDVARHRRTPETLPRLPSRRRVLARRIGIIAPAPRQRRPVSTRDQPFGHGQVREPMR